MSDRDLPDSLEVVNATMVLATPPISEDAIVSPADRSFGGHSHPRSAGVNRPRLVEGPAPSIESETVRLLMYRLRAAFLFLILAIALVFVRNLFLDDLGMQLLPGVTGLVITLAEVALIVSPEWTLRGLRRLERLVFAIVGVYIGLTICLSMVRKLEPGAGPIFASPIREGIREVVLAAILYGTFVPNTCRGAAKVILPLAAIPFLALGGVTLIRPDLMPVLRADIPTFEQWTSALLTLALGTGLALYGAHTIHDLRRREFASRQFGQYRLLDPLGRGGMGEVFLAEHQLLKRPCAVKVIRPEARERSGAVARFEREARSMARLSHPNTAAIYDYGSADDGSFYLAMEYIHGLTFDQLVVLCGPLPPSRAIYLLRQACGALEEAHRLGMVHRDVKPSNLMIHAPNGRYDVVKLLDFGLVRLLDPDAHRSSARALRGTPLFMAPEQAAGSPTLDGRADLYALGGTAYFLLTGRTPFDPYNNTAAVLANRMLPVEPMSEHRLGLPEDLERVVLRCLAKDPAQRFADAASLERALASCADAADWDSPRAAHWWREWHPNLLDSEPAQPPGPAKAGSGKLN